MSVGNRVDVNQGEGMDRLEFIIHSLRAVATDGPEPIADDMLAIAIGREIDNVAQQISGRTRAIETYMIHTKAVSA